MLRLLLCHAADGTPVQLEERLVNLDAAPGILEARLDLVAPGRWLLDHVPWTEAEHLIGAVAATSEVARHLNIRRGAACLCVERRTWRGEAPITFAAADEPGRRAGARRPLPAGRRALIARGLAWRRRAVIASEPQPFPEPLVQLLSRAVFGLASFVLMLLALGLILQGLYYPVVEFLSPGPQGKIALLGAVGYVIIAIAVFDVAKFLVEEEVLNRRESRPPRMHGAA